MVTEKQLQAIIRSSDLNIKAPKNAGCKGNKEKSVVCEICIHEIKRILQLNLQHENASFNISFVVHLRRTLQDFDPIFTHGQTLSRYFIQIEFFNEKEKRKK